MKDKGRGQIEFEFVNNSQDDLYLLTYHTPLEGLRSCYLSINHHKSESKMKYEGLIAKRPPPTIRGHCILMKPNEPHHANIDVVDAFSFPHSGEYTIEYTRPLVYFTKEGMAQHGEESPLPYTPKQHDYQPLSDMLKIFMEATPRREKRDEGVHKQYPGDNIVFIHGTASQHGTIRELHKELIGHNGYPKVIRAVRGNPDLYSKWFGDDSYKRHVLSVYKECYEHLQNDICMYQFGGSECTGNDFAYTYPGGHKVVLCGLYNQANTRSEFSGDDSKQQTLVHEWSHAFGLTNDDHGHGYGSDTCQRLAKHYPLIAVNNADNYGYFFCDVMLGVTYTE